VRTPRTATHSGRLPRKFSIYKREGSKEVLTLHIVCDLVPELLAIQDDD
jgi:hypothetical protein